jgi:outer membrane protein OmpA-like peptidoglycan-associated protein
VKKLSIIPIASVVFVLATSGCVSLSFSSITGTENGNKGHVIHVEKTGDPGFFHLNSPDELTREANQELMALCPTGRVSNVQTLLSQRDYLWVVQTYKDRVTAICEPLPKPPVAKAVPKAPSPPPAEIHAEKTERGLIFTLGAVLFATNASNLNPTAEESIHELSEYLKENPGRKVMVEGYTDSTGKSSYNHTLSLHRAKAVGDALVDSGISSGRIEIKGYGDDFPVSTNKTASGRQKNRRVEVVISDEHGHFAESR